MDSANVISILGLLGIGAIIKSLIDVYLDRIKIKRLQIQDFKQVRYKAIIILMYSYIDFENQQKMLIRNRPELNDKSKLYDELKVEWINMTLYASDTVIRRMKQFIQEPSWDSYTKTTLAMREDLYAIVTRLTYEDLKLP